MTKQLMRENATTTTQEMHFMFIPLSPLYEAFNNAMVQYHQQNSLIYLQGWERSLKSNDKNMGLALYYPQAVLERVAEWGKYK